MRNCLPWLPPRGSFALGVLPTTSVSLRACPDPRPPAERVEGKDGLSEATGSRAGKQLCTASTSHRAGLALLFVCLFLEGKEGLINTFVHIHIFSKFFFQVHIALL